MHQAVSEKQTQQKQASIAVLLTASFLLLCSPAYSQSKESITYSSTRTSHKVSGWEQGLVKRSPNLGKYYWTPLTEYSQKRGSRRTSKGAKKAGPQQTAQRQTRRYVLTKFAPLPVNNRAQFSAEQLNSNTDDSAKLNHSKKQIASSRPAEASQDVTGVLTYGDSKSEGYSEKQNKLSVSGKIYGRRK